VVPSGNGDPEASVASATPKLGRNLAGFALMV
jgi:hypothetical protein